MSQTGSRLRVSPLPLAVPTVDQPVDLIEHRAPRREIEVAKIRFVIQLGRFLVDAVMQVGRLDEAPQLVGGREGFGHSDDAGLRVAVVTGSSANRIRHAAPRLH